jgi:hypothetical protein
MPSELIFFCSQTVVRKVAVSWDFLLSRARKVLALNDTKLKGRQIYVREDREGGGPNSPLSKFLASILIPSRLFLGSSLVIVAEVMC